MSNQKNKSAAVPFVNQKGERSMKKVKVERYYAGKKPSYANDEDEDEYITDDGEDEEQTTDDDESEDGSRHHKSHRSRADSHTDEESGDDGDDDEDECGQEPRAGTSKTQCDKQQDDDDEEEDDPRFRHLKRVSKKPTPIGPAPSSRAHVKVEQPSRFIVQKEDEEDEEEIRQRHRIARSRALNEPLGAQAILGQLVEAKNEQLGEDEDDASDESMDTDDILGSFKPTATWHDETKIDHDKNQKAAESLANMLADEKAKAQIEAQTLRMVDTELKQDLEMEARAKMGLDASAKDINSVNTDDEDEEIAYEEWKLREIIRVVRDRSGGGTSMMAIKI